MSYQDYENYMRSVLGYQNDYNNIYSNNYPNYMENSYYGNYYSNKLNERAENRVNTDELNSLYPEIYKITYPAVCKLCNQNKGRNLTNELLEEMTSEIYNVVEPENRQETNQRNQMAPLKNGDVRNPNIKEPEISKETRSKNFVLEDLIKILIIREYTNVNLNREYIPRPVEQRRIPQLYEQQYGNYGRFY